MYGELACSRCRVIHEIDDPDKTTASWRVARGLAVCPGCVTLEERTTTPTLEAWAYALIVSGFAPRVSPGG